jgi:Ca2+-binding EF-hand superfamily protein
MLEDYMRKLFAIGDVNGDGVLSPVEFADLLSRSGFNLPAEVVLKLVKEADVNQDGVIEYEEFIPAMMRLRNAPPSYFDDTPEVASDMPKWDEVPEAMLEKYLGKLFAIGDSNGDGVLQPQEFLELLTRCGLRFPPEVVLDIFLKADVNGDGVIEYDEFIPAMKAIIAGAKQASAPSGMPDLKDVPPLMLEKYLNKLFQVADRNGDGVLQPEEFANLLSRSGFNFTQQQIATIIDAADVNRDGVIEYEEFVPAMSTLLQGDFLSGPSESENAMPAIADVPPEMLKRYLKKLFAVGDVNGDGVLQPEEMSRLLELSGFNLAPSQVAAIVDEADVNKDGVIEYDEFVPVAIGILQARSRTGAPTMPKIDDVPPAMLERYFKKLFAIADTNGDGVLQPAEFRRLLELSGFNLDASQVNELVYRADSNNNGVIEYDEFIPVAMDILRSRKSSGRAPMPRIEDVPAPMLERYFKKLFSIADTNRDGVLQPNELQRLFQLSGFGFSKAQVDSLMAQADTNRNGVIEYEEFIPVAMSILSQQQENIDTYLDTQDEQQARQFLLQGKTRDQLERQMKKIFLFADEDCSGNLDLREFKNCLGGMGLPLNAAQTSELMSMVDVNHDGKVDYEEFIPLAFELFVKVLTGKIVPPKAAPAQQRRKPAAAAAAAVPARKAPKPSATSDVASLEGRVLAVQSRRIIRSKIKDLFGRLDTDRDGRLTVRELASAFGEAMARRISATLDRNNDGRVTQYEMRRFFDDECAKAVESGVPEHKYLEGIVDVLESAF